MLNWTKENLREKTKRQPYAHQKTFTCMNYLKWNFYFALSRILTTIASRQFVSVGAWYFIWTFNLFLFDQKIRKMNAKHVYIWRQRSIMAQLTKLMRIRIFFCVKQSYVLFCFASFSRIFFDAKDWCHWSD